MRELGFVAALVLIICGFVYFSIFSARDSNPGQDTSERKYSTAINAARSVSDIVGAEKRRKLAVSLGIRAYDNPGDLPSLRSPVFSVEGQNSEILVVTSTSMSSGTCTQLAKSEYGVAASKEGFTEMICRDNNAGASYQVPLSRSE